jgi:DNA-binding response OmpR family regulator
MADDRLIGELLVQRGVATRAAVEEASVAAQGAGGRLCSRLLASGACDERDLAAALAERHGQPGVDLSRSVLDLAALDLVPRAVAENDLILPLSTEGERIHLAVDSPARAAQVLAEVRFVTGREVSTYLAVLAALEQAIAGAYQARGEGRESWRGAAAGPWEPHLEVVLPGGGEGAEPPAREPATEVADIDIVEAAADEVVATVQVAPGPQRILVVDDEPAIRLLAQRALQHHGYAVDTAADGEEALARVRAAPPDLLLLDAMLPRLHGFEVARKVRSDPATRHVPIVIMTAVYRGWRFAQDARQSYGAEDYVEKPFRVDDLVRRLEAILRARSAGSAEPRPGAGPAIGRGRELLAAGRSEEASEVLGEAVRTDPFSAEAHWLLGKSQRLRGDAFRAMTSLERAVELQPDLFPALKALSATYLEKGFRTKATEILERAVQAAPDEATRGALRGELLKLL